MWCYIKVIKGVGLFSQSFFFDQANQQEHSQYVYGLCVLGWGRGPGGGNGMVQLYTFRLFLIKTILRKQ